MYLFNDGMFTFWAVFRVVDRSRRPILVQYLGVVRVKDMPHRAIQKRFPGMDFEIRVAWKSQVNRWRRKYPHKTLYKAPYKLNRAMCVNCLDVIESMYTHDYVTCSCGMVSVDGGYDYFKRVGMGIPNGFEEMP